MAKVGLAAFADRFPRKLSGGQQQRVAIARAMAMAPEIMLFDEVTSALDPELVGEVLDVMKQLATDGTTMIVVTHEMAFARDVADQVLVMDAGQVVEQGRAEEVLLRPTNPRTASFLSRFHSTIGERKSLGELGTNVSVEGQSDDLLCACGLPDAGALRAAKDRHQELPGLGL